MTETRTVLAREVRKGDSVIEKDGYLLDVIECRLSKSGGLVFFTLDPHGMTGLVKATVRATKSVRVAA